MKVRIRKEKEAFQAYFLDSGRLIEVNAQGAEILDLLLNQNHNREEIVRELAQKYGQDEMVIEKDVDNFLVDVKEQIAAGGFNLVDQKQLDTPFGVELEITNACNLRCKHCFQSDYNEEFMDLERVCWTLDLLAKNGVCEVSIIGGEPLVHPNLLDILKHGYSLDLSQSITTNATLLTKEIIADISRIPHVTAMVSLDGIGEIHDRIRGNGVFAKVDRAIKMLLANHVEVDTIFTLNSINAQHYSAAINYCESLGIACNFNLFKPFKPNHANLTIDPDRYFQIVIDLFKLRRKGKQVGISNSAIVGELMGLPPRNECTATLSGLVIDYRGRMVTCPGLVTAGHYSETDLPLFDEKFVKTWQKHWTFCQFKENGLRNCQVRSFLFSKDISGHDPYGIEAFREYRSGRGKE